MRWVPLLLAAGLLLGSAGAMPVWREEFRMLPDGWELRARRGVPPTRYRADPEAADGAGALILEADGASAAFATQLDGIDLARTPILRWRWRVRELPRGADGRDPERDDQAIGIYISAGGFLRQRSIAYRWETDTPVGSEGDAVYVGGIVRVHWIAVRNAADGTDAYHIEERNVAADFARVFGFVPDDPIIAVSGNSQYTGTRAVAELDWIELAPLVELHAPR